MCTIEDDTNRNETLSIVIPLLNEQDNIRQLYNQLKEILEQQWLEYEIVFVDDGSTDRSADVIKQISEENCKVKLLGLSRNFGTQRAIFAGLEFATGSAVIVMDADLQHPPSLVEDMIAKWKEGYEVVYAIRQNGHRSNAWKRFLSTTFTKILSLLAKSPVHPDACDFRLLDRRVVDQIISMRECRRYFRGLVSWVGFRQTGVPFNVKERHSGETKYRFRSLFTLAFDAITSFSTLPLRLCTIIGAFATVSVIPYALWAIYVGLFQENAVPGWASIIVAILFLGGVQLISLGILGEYVGRIYDEVKRRPLYIVREKIGFEENAPSERRVPEEQSPSLDEQESVIV